MAIELTSFSHYHPKVVESTSSHAPVATTMSSPIKVSTAEISRIVELSLEDLKRANQSKLCSQDRKTATIVWSLLHDELIDISVLGIIKSYLPSPTEPNLVKNTLSNSTNSSFKWGSIRTTQKEGPPYSAEGTGELYIVEIPPLSETPSWAKTQPHIAITCSDHLKHIVDVRDYQPTKEGPNYSAIKNWGDYIRLTLSVCLKDKCTTPCEDQPTGRILTVLDKKKGRIFGIENRYQTLPAVKVVAGCPTIGSKQLLCHRINESLFADISIIRATSENKPEVSLILYPSFNPRTCAALQATCPKRKQNPSTDSRKCVIS